MEGQLNTQSLLDDWHPHLMSKGETSHPVEHFCCLYLQCHSSNQAPALPVEELNGQQSRAARALLRVHPKRWVKHLLQIHKAHVETDTAPGRLWCKLVQCSITKTEPTLPYLNLRFHYRWNSLLSSTPCIAITSRLPCNNKEKLKNSCQMRHTVIFSLFSSFFHNLISAFASLSK